MATASVSRLPSAAASHHWPPCLITKLPFPSNIPISPRPTIRLHVISKPITTSAAASHHWPPCLITKLPFPSNIPISPRPTIRLHVISKPITTSATATSKKDEETIFFDGGSHYGDLLANIILGFTLIWLPLSLAAVFRAFFLRYRFTNLRVTVISGLTGQDRSDFSYDVIKDVQVVPRFIGEWGDVIITLRDGTKVDLRSVPKFREIAKYCLFMADKPVVLKDSASKGF